VSYAGLGGISDGWYYVIGYVGGQWTTNAAAGGPWFWGRMAACNAARGGAGYYNQPFWMAMWGHQEKAWLYYGPNANCSVSGVSGLGAFGQTSGACSGVQCPDGYECEPEMVATIGGVGVVPKCVPIKAKSIDDDLASKSAEKACLSAGLYWHIYKKQCVNSREPCTVDKDGWVLPCGGAESADVTAPLPQPSGAPVSQSPSKPSVPIPSTSVPSAVAPPAPAPPAQAQQTVMQPAASVDWLDENWPWMAGAAVGLGLVALLAAAKE
jgi:hypothetical protein